MATVALSERRSLASKRRLDALMETIFAYAALIGINLLWFDQSLGWLDTVLHPYFVVVLLIAVRYGTIDGMVAGAMGATLWIWFKLDASPGVFESPGAFFDIALMRTPYLLLAIGTLLGEVRQVAQDEIDTLWGQYRQLQDDLDVIGGQSKSLRKANESLQERIASSTETTAGFYEVASAIQTLRENEALPALLAVVQRFVGAEKVSIYVRGPSAWELHISEGWASDDEYPRSIPFSNPVMARVDKGETLSLMEVPETGDTGIVLAAPLHLGEGAEQTVHAVIAVQSLPLSRLNLATIRNLEGISAWGSRVVTSAQLYEKVRERDPHDDVTGVLRYSYALARMDEEAGRWRRYHTPSAMLIIRVNNYERVPKRKRAAFLRRVGKMLQGHVRNIDLVSRWRTADSFALVLPSTDATGARILAARISSQFARDVLSDVPRSAELTLKFGLGATGEHGDQRDELVRAAERMELT